MRIILSPAKKMNRDPDSLDWTRLPQFLPQAQELLDQLRTMEPKVLQRLWRCNDSLAAQNLRRLGDMDLRRDLTPALLSYEGLQYQYMAPGVLEDGDLDYIGTHLRILSGFYGLLRPFDGVVPYRLEMQARLSLGGCRDLYAYWGDRLAAQLAREGDCLLNLASQEYSRAVVPHLPRGMRLIGCTFGEEAGDKVLEKGTRCKMARGEMVRWMAQHRITRPEDLTYFDHLGYAYAPRYAAPDHLVFLQQSTPKGGL